jgi:RES domain-containing protein
LSLPLPPSVLPKNPPLRELRPGLNLVRFYDPGRGSWNRQRFYGPVKDMRFDHHPPPPGDTSGRSVWYSARSLVGAVSEAFGNEGLVDKWSRRRVCFVRLRSTLKVLSLSGSDPHAFNLDQRIGTDRSYEVSQAWARAFYDSYSEIQGIHWSGRHSGSICVVFNDRAPMSSLELIQDADISHPLLWPRVARAAVDAYLEIVT